MTIWTSFCPQKVCWELTSIETAGKAATSEWQANLPVVSASLQRLHEAGLTGIRLVIYPDELTKDGKIFDWKPVDNMLELCQTYHLLVDLCVGPYQYPNFPGVYLPKSFLELIQVPLDSHPEVREYGLKFLEQQILRYKDHQAIHGFHLANEWPDHQKVKGKEHIRTRGSEAFMLECIERIKQFTNKPILLNTNVDASFPRQVHKTFQTLFHALGAQGKLGLDIYPTQATWKKAGIILLKRLFIPYRVSAGWVKKLFQPSEIYFCEVEAQPWGSGQSWYKMIKDEEDPNIKILNYTKESLSMTLKEYILPVAPEEVSLWGGDFWICAEKMGVTWPIEQVSELAKNKFTI